MGHLEASQFNGAHYGNQLNAEQRDKCELFTSPSPDIQQLLMGAHLQPSSVIQPSLSAPPAHLQGEMWVCSRDLPVKLLLDGEKRRRGDGVMQEGPKWDKICRCRVCSHWEWGCGPAVRNKRTALKRMRHECPGVLSNHEKEQRAHRCNA